MTRRLGTPDALARRFIERALDDVRVRELGERRLYAAEERRVAREKDESAVRGELAEQSVCARLVVAVIRVNDERAELFEVCEAVNLLRRRARQKHVEPAVVELFFRETHEVELIL